MRIIYIMPIVVYDLWCPDRCNVRAYGFRHFNIWLDRYNNKYFLNHIAALMYIKYFYHRTRPLLSVQVLNLYHKNNLMSSFLSRGLIPTR